MFAYDLNRIPSVAMTGKVTERTGWSHGGRSMETNLLVIFHGGECTFRIENEDFVFRRGDVALVPQHTPYCPHTEKSSEYTFFHFDGELIPCGPPQPPSAPERGAPMYGRYEKSDCRMVLDYKMSLGNKAAEVDALLSRCLNTQRLYAGKKQLLLSIQFAELLFCVSQAYCEQFAHDGALPASVQKLLLYLQDHYTQSVALEDIERHMGVSRQYCMRLFKRHMHTTIHEYILDLRMRHAAYLLRHTYMNVNQAADYLGFSSVSYFSRVFKQYYGVPPSEYFE